MKALTTSRAVLASLAGLAAAANFPTITTTSTGSMTLCANLGCSMSYSNMMAVSGSDTCNAATYPKISASDGLFGSFVISERPWCDNGSVPYFNVYADESCDQLLQSFSYESTGPNADGACVVASGTFQGAAFICDGLDAVGGDDEDDLDDGGDGGDGDDGDGDDDNDPISGQMSWMDATATAQTEETTATALPLLSTSSFTTVLSTSEPSPSHSTSALSSPKSSASTSTVASISALPTASPSHTAPSSGASKMGPLFAVSIAAAVMFCI